MGATIILSGRNMEKLENVKSLLSEGNHSIVQADLTSAEAREQLVKIIPTIDGLVHSAGIVESFPVKMMTENEIESLMTINYKAPFLITAALSKNRKLKTGASIVFISSTSSQRPFKGGAVYSASKASLEALSKTIAVEFSTQKIRSNCLCPALVKTQIYDDALNSIGSERVENHLSRYPLGLGNPEDVANAAVFLLSDASRWITGTNIILDGGFLLSQ